MQVLVMPWAAHVEDSMIFSENHPKSSGKLQDFHFKFEKVKKKPGKQDFKSCQVVCGQQWLHSGAQFWLV